jgi:hypothetical protein
MLMPVLVNCICVLFWIKNKEGVYQFRNIATEVAYLVKRFISGEHGDGIVRGEFCLYDWRENYELLKRIKLAFEFSFEYGKNCQCAKMDENLRFETGREEPNIKTIQDFQIVWGFTCCRKCNGSGDCRNYPRQEERCAYRATRNEKILLCSRQYREYLTIQKERINSIIKKLYEVLNCALVVKLALANVRLT